MGEKAEAFKEAFQEAKSAGATTSQAGQTAKAAISTPSSTPSTTTSAPSGGGGGGGGGRTSVSVDGSAADVIAAIRSAETAARTTRAETDILAAGATIRVKPRRLTTAADVISAIRTGGGGFTPPSPQAVALPLPIPSDGGRGAAPTTPTLRPPMEAGTSADVVAAIRRETAIQRAEAIKVKESQLKISEQVEPGAIRGLTPKEAAALKNLNKEYRENAYVVGQAEKEAGGFDGGDGRWPGPSGPIPTVQDTRRCGTG